MEIKNYPRGMEPSFARFYKERQKEEEDVRSIQNVEAISSVNLEIAVNCKIGR